MASAVRARMWSWVKVQMPRCLSGCTALIFPTGHSLPDGLLQCMCDWLRRKWCEAYKHVSFSARCTK
eukprot:1078201-Pelagomonas_calceolata.AAC.2